MIFFAAVIIASLCFVVTVILLVRDIRALEQRHDDLLLAWHAMTKAARRVDDRLTYYEHRADGLKGLRAAYDKRIAKKIAQLAQDNDASDAAPEGTAQAERLVG